ncbi:MAG: transposase [Bacteroidota bacterium]|nr:transposase [Bacteroidota bacterium]
MHCRLNPLEPVKEAAKTIKNHLWGILISTFLKVTNGPAECTNKWIGAIKIRLSGFRNKDRLVNAIYFHLGGLDLIRRV